MSKYSFSYWSVAERVQGMFVLSQSPVEELKRVCVCVCVCVCVQKDVT